MQRTRERSGLELAVLAGAAACAAVAGWLFLVAATVLPRRDPGNLGTWIVIAVAILAYAAIGAGWAAGVRRSLLRGLAIPSSLAAVAGGAWLTIGALLASEFEGYLLLIGGLLVAQGVVVLAATVLGTGSATAG